MGLTGAYGVNDPSLTRERVKADLTVFQNHLNHSRGMLEACKEQLKWSVGRYARYPDEPELLALQDVPPLAPALLKGIWFAFVWLVGSMCVLAISEGIFVKFLGVAQSSHNQFAMLVMFGGVVVAAVFPARQHFSAKAANGTMPEENARRQHAYREAVAAALKAAEPVKAAADHRLRVQIRELESLLKTLGERQEDVRRILATL